LAKPVTDATEDEFYAAMDWLIERQGAIEKRLANRHLKSGGLVLFDLTRATSRASPVRSPGSATAATASAARCRSITGF
jgi:hypothetical protein